MEYEDYDDHEVTFKSSSGSHSQKSRSDGDKRKKRLYEETFQKMQKIISKKGYVDADAMRKLMKKLNQDDTTSAKQHVGGGDREETVYGKMGKKSSKRPGMVQFKQNGIDQNSAHSPSDVTIYNQAVMMKSNLKRPSTSSEEEMDIDFVDSSDEMEFLEHNSNQIMAENFIADMKQHYDANVQNREERLNSSYGRHELPSEEDKLDSMIRDAEANKAKILGTPGRYHYLDTAPQNSVNVLTPT